MKFHVRLVCSGVVVLSPASFAPVGLGLLEGALDFGIEEAISLGGSGVEGDCEDVGLDTELEDGTAVFVVLAKGALGALVSASCASGDVCELWWIKEGLDY